MTSKFRHRIHFDKKYYGYSSGCRNRNNLFGGLGSIRFSIRQARTQGGGGGSLGANEPPFEMSFGKNNKATTVNELSFYNR